MENNELDKFDLKKPISRSYIERKKSQLDWNIDDMFNLMLGNHLNSGERKLLIELDYDSEKDRYSFEIYGEKNRK